MYIDNRDNWSGFSNSNPQTFKTLPGNWHGIAIGPDSREGRVRVNGMLLTAGRVLPIATGGQAYAVEGVVSHVGTSMDLNAEPNAADGDTDNRAVPLQLVLFHTVAEAAAYAANAKRPAWEYISPWQTLTLTGAIAANAVPTFAWSYGNRRASHIAFYVDEDAPADEDVLIEIWGYRSAQLTTLGIHDWEPQLAKQNRLYSGTLLIADAQAGGPWGQIVVGGTNEEEAYEALGVICSRAVGTAVTRMRVHALNVGEL